MMTVNRLRSAYASSLYYVNKLVFVHLCDDAYVIYAAEEVQSGCLVKAVEYQELKEEKFPKTSHDLQQIDVQER